MRDTDTAMPEGNEAPAPDAEGELTPAPPRPVLAARYRRSHRDGERWLRTVAVTGGTIILLATVSGQAVKNSDAAAWLSMLFNGVMALAAIGAYLTARKWVPQLTTQEGYKLAITLINDHYIWLGIQNSVVRDVTLPLACIRHQYDQESLAGSSLTITELITSLEQAVLQHKIRRDTMAQIRFRLGTYGLHDAAEFAEHFQALDRAYMLASEAAASILEILKDTQDRQKIYPPRNSGLASDGYVRELYLPLVSQAEERYRVVSEQFQVMADTHEKIFASCPTIGQLFEVRK